jgi:hypothetical protein
MSVKEFPLSEENNADLEVEMDRAKTSAII